MHVNTFSITLENAFMVSPRVKHFVFSCKLSPPFHYLPGQFITIHFEKNGKKLKRSYSIANPPEQKNLIEFAAGYVENGPGTEFLFNLNPGDHININGPFGRLILKDHDPKRYILVATSTGITPFLAMLNELSARLKQNPALKIVILQGIQTQDDILYENEFSAFAKKHPQVLFRAYLSRELNPDDEKGHYHGHVQQAFPELNLNPEQDVIYLCGNPAMIDDAFTLLKNQDFAIQQIIREKYISTGS